MKTIKKKSYNLNFDLINKSDKVFIVSNKQLKIKKKNTYIFKNHNFIKFKNFKKKNKNILISCIYSHIIPKRVLDKFDFCFNIHPATNQYPGRDPHHWAHYHKTKFWGATLHYMTDKVDDGKIIFQKKKQIDITKFTPTKLKLMSEKISLRILNNLLNNKIIIKKKLNIRWGNIKYKRADFYKICNLKNIKKKFHKKIVRSFSIRGYNNIIR